MKIKLNKVISYLSQHMEKKETDTRMKRSPGKALSNQKQEQKAISERDLPIPANKNENLMADSQQPTQKLLRKFLKRK